MATPATAPPERLEWCEEAGAADVVPTGADVGVEPAVATVVAVVVGRIVLAASGGHGSPGCSMIVESRAYVFCFSSDTEAFGLMTPCILVR